MWITSLRWAKRPILAAAVTVVMMAVSGPALADLEAGNQAYARNDYDTAFKEWLPLAEAGDAQAQNNIGFLYRRGRGVHPDFKEAAKWYRRAAEQGFTEAMTNLGKMYDEGWGVEQDFVESYKWFYIAYMNGVEDVPGHLEILKDFMTAEQIEEAKQRAAAWEPKPGGPVTD